MYACVAINFVHNQSRPVRARPFCPVSTCNLFKCATLQIIKSYKMFLLYVHTYGAWVLAGIGLAGQTTRYTGVMSCRNVHCTRECCCCVNCVCFDTCAYCGCSGRVLGATCQQRLRTRWTLLPLGACTAWPPVVQASSSRDGLAH